MADYQRKPGTGTVWKNEKYENGGNQPYAKGTVLDLDGNELDIVLWIPRSEKIKGFNVTLQEKWNKNTADVSPSKGINAGTDDLPF